MLELETILIGALQDEDIVADRAMPGMLAGRLTRPACALALTEAEAPETAFGQYLGMLEDDERGEIELYGRRFEARVEISLYAPDGTAQLSTFSDQVLSTLMAVPGLTIQSFYLDAPVWDDEAEAFLRILRMQVKGILYYLHQDEDEWFTDFSLVPTIS